MAKGFSAYDSALMVSNSFKLLLDEHMLARITGNCEKIALVVPVL